MAEPKLELVKVKRRLNRLELVKERAKFNTNRRINLMNEEKELKELESKVERVEEKKGKQ